ncbi:MAG: ABC transporter permease, partial [Planctomycetes bacterium]|nr:ABC transporter permease [Planctomycetota bacterium]
AAVIGGASLNGGRGSILGTLAGAAMMVVIESGCNALGISNSYTNIVIGAIIIAAAALDQVRQRRLAG